MPDFGWRPKNEPKPLATNLAAAYITTTAYLIQYELSRLPGRRAAAHGLHRPARPAAQTAPATPLRTAPDSARPAPPVAAEAPAAPVEAEPAADTTGEYETMYVVIAATSRQYRPLRQQMLRLQAVTQQRIDTLGRFYDPQKNLIRLPDQAPAGEEKFFDDMYAGEYYPRRMSDATLSVEYTNQYAPARPQSMALVAGIFGQPRRADSLLAVVRRTAPAAFRVKTRMYMGCMH